jgi:L-aspartate oxidase
VTDLLVLGSGIAGLSAAVRARRAGLSVAIVTKGELGWSTTRYAQGGVAAALSGSDDSPELHGADTLTAGAGLCDPDAVSLLVGEGPARVRELIDLGTEFDRADGDLARVREGGHSVARVVHAGGDATGAEIERSLVAAVRVSGAEMHESTFATDLVVEGGRVRGVRVLDRGGAAVELRATQVLVATGGAGQCFALTTNPALSTGDGIAMAMRAGAAVADLEFMQFHPTALHDPGAMPRPLLSEALRGEGAILRDEHGVAFMVGEHPLADLAPRDVVARAIARRCNDRGLDHLWLDTTTIDDFARRFPTIWGSAQAVGLDPTTDWLPVAPAAHYLSGGVCTDLDGATTLPGLWACGEAACSGVHGANRLASNSLLEGLVFAARAVEAIGRGKDGAEASGVLRGIEAGPARVPTAVLEAAGSPIRDSLQRVMTRDAGVLRSAESLDRAAETIAGLVPTDLEDANLLTVARVLVASARAREESRGTHTRLDFPESSPAFLGRFVVTTGTDEQFVPLPRSTASDAIEPGSIAGSIAEASR